MRRNDGGGDEEDEDEDVTSIAGVPVREGRQTGLGNFPSCGMVQSGLVRTEGADRLLAESTFQR